MRQRFVPPSYQRDLRKKLQHLDLGDMSVQDYYAELQKGMIHAGLHEETDDKICHFYGGLWTKIQDIIDYKEYNIVNHLFQLAMLGEKELQGRQPTRLKSSFTPHHTSITPSTSHAPATAHFFHDTFNFTCTFHIDDTTTSTSCFGDDTTSTSCSSKTVFVVNHIHPLHLWY
jgi:hypothetical protein